MDLIDSHGTVITSYHILGQIKASRLIEIDIFVDLFRTEKV